VHTGERAHRCERCGRAYQTPCALRRHVASVHAPAPAHACEVCEKRFRTIDGIRQHERLHERPDAFACAVCERAYANASALRLHKLKAHDDTHADLRARIALVEAEARLVRAKTSEARARLARTLRARDAAWRECDRLGAVLAGVRGAARRG
jgi:hypothetical protein